MINIGETIKSGPSKTGSGFFPYHWYLILVCCHWGCELSSSPQVHDLWCSGRQTCAEHQAKHAPGRCGPLDSTPPFLSFTKDSAGDGSTKMAPIPVTGSKVDHGIDAFCAFTTGIAVTVTADPELKDPMLMLVPWAFYGGSEVSMMVDDVGGYTKWLWHSQFAMENHHAINR